MKTLKKSVREWYKNIIFNLSAKNSWLIKLFYTRFYQPKKGSLSSFYHSYSLESPHIFVIQVGANDGINHDPIHKFIKRDGWSGILIEPQPYVFRNKLHPLYRRNQNIALENIAISQENCLMDMYRLSFTNERWATGLTTFDKEVLQKRVNSGGVDFTAQKQGVKTPEKREDYIENFKVEAKSFDFLIEKYQTKKVDVLQIDAEGFDFELVKLFDLGKCQPDVVVFEADHISEQDFEEVESYLNSHSYVFKKVGRDVLAVNKSATIANKVFKAF